METATMGRNSVVIVLVTVAPAALSVGPIAVRRAPILLMGRITTTHALHVILAPSHKRKVMLSVKKLHLAHLLTESGQHRRLL